MSHSVADLRKAKDFRGGLQILQVHFVLTFEIRKFGELKGYRQEFLSCDWKIVLAAAIFFFIFSAGWNNFSTADVTEIRTNTKLLTLKIWCLLKAKALIQGDSENISAGNLFLHVLFSPVLKRF